MIPNLTGVMLHVKDAERHSYCFQAARLLILSILLILMSSCRSDTDQSLVSVGQLVDFPPYSVTPIELASSFVDPDPPAIGSETPGVVTQPASATISPVSIFLVHDPAAGLLALYNRDPHLGCRVNWEVDTERFVNPCHGEQYSLTGECLDGPCPRGLDRFEVTVTEQGEVRVAVSKFQYGLPRE